MLKWIAKKIIGAPKVLDTETFSQQSSAQLMLNVGRLKDAFERGDARKVTLLSLWLGNRGLQPPKNVAECDDELLRLGISTKD